MKNLSLKEKSVIQLIKSKESYANYFFGKYNKTKLFSLLKKEGFFLPSNNPIPEKVKNGYRIPEWNVLQYLERISLKTRKLDDELLEIIKDVSLFKKENKYVDNYRTRWYFVKILLNIPLKKVPLEFFDTVIPTWLVSMFDLTLPGADLLTGLLPNYLNQIKSKGDMNKVEKLVSQVLSIEEVKLKKSILGKTFEVKTRIQSYWIEESLIKKNNASLIAKKCTNAPIFNLADTIRYIFNKKYEKQDYSSIWLRDLTKEQAKSIHNEEYFLAVILRKLALEKIKYNKKEGSEIVEKFLSDIYPHTLFKRLAIVLISEEWDSYGKYFDQILEDESENYFENDSFAPEIAHLLREHITKFTNEQKAKLETIIEKGSTKNIPEDKKEEYVLYWKQSLYRILDKDPRFKDKYEEIKKITKRDIKLPEYNVGGVFQEEFDKSPVSAEEFLKKNNDEIVKYIKGYKPQGAFPNSSSEGIYRTFQTAVELEPEKFTKDLSPFITQDYHLLSGLYSGLEEAWKQKKDILWKDVINFTNKLLHTQWFWKPTGKEKRYPYDYFSWTLSAIGDLLQEGSKTDDWAFSEELHKDVEKIIVLLINKLPKTNDLYQGDGVTHALNSSWGKAIIALIYLGLREARLSDKKVEKRRSKWSKSLKGAYENAMKKNVYEAYTLLGQYLPNLHYIDEEWTKNYIKNIHKLKGKKIFETFMEGYLFTGNIYNEIYKSLKKSYERALTIDFEEKRIQERLIQHIAVGYLRGNEKLGDNSLIDKLISLNKQEYIREIINFLWHEKDHVLSKNVINKNIEKENEEFKKRILAFWDHIIDLLTKKKKYSQEDKKILSEFAKLAAYLPEIDDKAYERLMLSAPYVTVDFDSTYFIEYLNELKDKGDKHKSAIFVGKLFLAMLKGSEELVPNYKWENIEEIVLHLYKIGEKNKKVKDLANQICVFYAEHGNLNLRSLYEESNAVS